MKVSEQIIQVLEYLCEKFGIVVDWNADNVLPVVQKLCEKYIRWEIATSVVWMVLGVMFLTVGFISLSKAKAAFKRCVNDEETECDELVIPFTCIFTVVGFVAGVIIISTQVFDITKCCALPELQVYEYIRYLS